MFVFRSVKHVERLKSEALYSNRIRTYFSFSSVLIVDRSGCVRVGRACMCMFVFVCVCVFVLWIHCSHLFYHVKCFQWKKKQKNNQLIFAFGFFFLPTSFTHSVHQCNKITLFNLFRTFLSMPKIERRNEITEHNSVNKVLGK